MRKAAHFEQSRYFKSRLIIFRQAAHSKQIRSFRANSTLSKLIFFFFGKHLTRGHIFADRWAGVSSAKPHPNHLEICKKYSKLLIFDFLFWTCADRRTDQRTDGYSGRQWVGSENGVQMQCK